MSRRNRCLQKIHKFDRKTPILESLFNKVAESLLKETPTQVFSCKICEVFKSNYFEEHLRMTASEFIGDTTLFHETILKKHRNGKINFQDGKEYNRRQHFEW